MTDDKTILVRELKKEDIWNGFLKSLDSLRHDTSSSIGPDRADAIFEKINSNPDHVVAVAQVDGAIVGASTLFIESKFIHDGGLVGHIEDVAVAADFQGRGVGKKIIQYVMNMAKERGCYKIVLGCTDDVKPFYEKLGFRQVLNQLRFDCVDV